MEPHHATDDGAMAPEIPGHDRGLYPGARKAVTIVAPDVCGQRGLYYGTKPNPPSKLYGPNKPYEPPFLHQISRVPRPATTTTRRTVEAAGRHHAKATASTICEIGRASNSPAGQRHE